ncbi:hypothetical protein L2E82_40333 [Cichorium intybus]|uniref:Uncharacterized protein n=1 Tax=Cichorium intybus TaxID=13427 RepID=A0ACB9ALP4_CICIN|nr:hypothetical protein L2E82_40333 [Cichorium intybus]
MQSSFSRPSRVLGERKPKSFVIILSLSLSVSTFGLLVFRSTVSFEIPANVLRRRLMFSRVQCSSSSIYLLD